MVGVFILGKEVGGHLQFKSTLLSLCINDVKVVICSSGVGSIRALFFFFVFSFCYLFGNTVISNNV